jgi:hypothetical protein
MKRNRFGRVIIIIKYLKLYGVNRKNTRAVLKSNPAIKENHPEATGTR